MPLKLNPGFYEYLNNLPIKGISKANYRQYARWIEKYGTGTIPPDTKRGSTLIANLIETVAKNYNDDHKSDAFNQYRRYDANVVLNHYLKFLKSPDDEVAQAQEALDHKGGFDITNQKDGKEKVYRSIALRRGQPKFRKTLLKAYQGRCCVSDTDIEDVLEAAHIIPYNGKSTNHVCNGLLLRSDIHALFDLKLLSINPESMTVCCSEKIKCDEFYRKMDGKKVVLPKSKSEHPSKDALKMHFDSRIL